MTNEIKMVELVVVWFAVDHNCDIFVAAGGDGEWFIEIRGRNLAEPIRIVARSLLLE